MVSESSMERALRDLSSAFGADPAKAIRRIEGQLPLISTERAVIEAYILHEGFSAGTFQSALHVKRSVGQINVLVHAAGILTSLPYIVEHDEKIVSVSLGAGNTGKEFDLVTDRRVAEFKFIAWRGGPESIRQNQLFKDFLKLLWDQSGRRKQLFLTGTAEALRFLRGGRALSSILSRGDAVKQAFASAYGEKFSRVGEFYAEFERDVEIIDLQAVVPTLARTDMRSEPRASDEHL